MEGASPACRRGLDWPSRHDDREGREEVRLRMLRLLPPLLAAVPPELLMSVVTVPSKVVSKVLNR